MPNTSAKVFQALSQPEQVKVRREAKRLHQLERARAGARQDLKETKRMVSKLNRVRITGIHLTDKRGKGYKRLKQWEGELSTRYHIQAGTVEWELLKVATRDKGIVEHLDARILALESLFVQRVNPTPQLRADMKELLKVRAVYSKEYVGILRHLTGKKATPEDLPGEDDIALRIKRQQDAKARRAVEEAGDEG